MDGLHFRPLTPRQQRWRNAGIFLLTLAVSVALFTAGAFAVLRGLRREPPSVSQPETEAAAPLYLLAVTANGREADGFLLFEIGQRVTVTALPRETEVTVGTGYATLAQLFAGGTRTGMEAVCSAIARMRDITLHKYIVFSVDGVGALLHHLGDDLIFTMPEPIRYEGTLPLQLPAGRQTLSAVQGQALLCCPAALFAGGRATYASLRASLAQAVYNQYAVPQRADALAEDFKAAVNCAAATNLLISDLVGVQERLYALRMRNGGTLCRAVTVAGSFVGYGEDVRFYPEE